MLQLLARGGMRRTRYVLANVNRYLANVAPALHMGYMGKPHLWFTQTEHQKKRMAQVCCNHLRFARLVTC